MASPPPLRKETGCHINAMNTKCADPVAQQILNKYPLQPAIGAVGENTYNRCSSSRQMTTISVRLDYKISEKDSIFGRASYINNSQKGSIL